MRVSNAFKSILVLLLALFLITGFTMASPANNAPTEKVIIGFKGKPDASLVKAHDGKINYQYTIVDAIAATVPGKAIDALEKNPNVKYVEKDHKAYAIQDTLDWGIDRIDAEIVWGGSEDSTDITTDKAGTGVKVAILDTGIDYNHPDLDSNYVGGVDYVEDDGDPMDDNGHGTHCAGIVAAEDNNDGVIGVAPKVSLYAVKVLDSGGSGYYSDIVAGIEWAASNNMDVISMSLGGSSGSTTLKNACDNAYNGGTLVVAAAGNEGNPGGGGDNVGYPARYDSVIAVAATDDNDNRASFSSTGPDVELAAPGVDILSTYLNDRYAYGSGTSMACPHVSGTAALIFAAGVSDSNNDGKVTDEVRSLLQSTAEDLGANGRDEKFGYGLVDAEAAVKAAEGSTNSPPTADFTYTTNDLTVDFTDQSTDSDGSIVGWSWDFGDGSTSTTQNPSHTYSTDGTYTVSLTVTDDDGATDTTSQDVTVSSSTITSEMHIQDVNLFLDRTRGPWEDIGVKVKVVDSNGNGVIDATVDIQLKTPEDNFLTGTATTDSSGVASTIFDKASRTSGTYNATVTGLSHSSYTWNTTADVETSDTLTTS